MLLAGIEHGYACRSDFSQVGVAEQTVKDLQVDQIVGSVVLRPVGHRRGAGVEFLRDLPWQSHACDGFG